MRAVLVTPGFPISLDDHHKPFLADHARALAAAGADVTVVCPRDPRAPRCQNVAGVEVRRVRFAPARIEARVALGESYRVFAGPSALWVIPMIVRLIAAAAREARLRAGGSRSPGADAGSAADGPVGVGAVIHGHWWFPCGLVAVAAAGVARRRTASVVQLHGSDAAVTSGAVRRWLARRVLRRAGAVVAVSEDLRDWASSLLPRPRGLRPPPSAGSAEGPSRHLLRVVPMPVSTERLGPVTPVPAHGPVVAVGRLMAEKGFDVLIDAAALMAPDERPELAIVGDGPDSARLRALALRSGVAVRFVGAVAPSEIGEWYRRARLVCVPSRREGFGMVVAEALAAGRPVVATSVGAIPGLIADGDNGCLAPPGDAAALAEALAKAQKSDFDAAAPTTSLALAPLRPKAHAASMLEIYESVTAARARPRSLPSARLLRWG